jgi:hypothetical protein
MKTITLSRLILRDFKGFTFQLNADGADVDIYGRNATGKTTIADAFSWLLFDKDSLGRADFEIKTLDAGGQAQHGLEHSVEGHLTVNGVPVELKKTYREIWTKKRSNPVAEYTGNTTDYWIDGVPAQKKEYTARVAELAGDEAIFRLVTTPSAFPALHWQKQRAILLDICGALTDSEVIESDDKLAPLSGILGKRTTEEHRKVIAAKKAEINKELQTIPVRIDEVRRGMPDVTGLDRKAIIKNVGVLEGEFNDAKLRLQGIETGGKVAEHVKALALINADLQQIENKHYVQGMAAVQKINQQIAEASGVAQREALHSQNVRSEIALKEKRIMEVEQELSILREGWKTADAEAFEDTTNDTCAACGQALPEERVEAAREKARGLFNVAKARRLTDIETRGKMLAGEVAKYRADIEALEKTIVLVTNLDPGYIEQLTRDRDAAKLAAEEYLLIPGRAELIVKRDVYEAGIQAEKAGLAEHAEKLQAEVNRLTVALSTAKAEADQFTRREAGEARIEELKAEEKRLTTEFERLEKELYLTEQFVRVKVQLLTEKINAKFELARFKLFDVQVNGALDECCELMVNGVGYNSNLNSGMRINAGLDVCRTLMHHYGLVVPIIIDNAETVCDLLRLDTQMIRLIVSEKDSLLRIEQSSKNRAAA